MNTVVSELQEYIRASAASGRSLRIIGSASKDFYGGPLIGEPLHTHQLSGIIDYEPAELVITAGSGTSLTELEALLAERGQMLAFEPPHFNGAGTLGGTVAAGLSGPRRAYCASVRDCLLGVKLIDGQGRLLRFGGQVIKNVAGFDASRLMAGSLGTLGLLTEVTLKVLPRPACELSVVYEVDEATALQRCNEWAGRPLPLSATCYFDGRLYVRLSGARAAVQEARENLGGELLNDDAAFWMGLRDHTAAFFAAAPALWRLSVPATTPPLKLAAPQLIEWGGALRWLSASQELDTLREQVSRVGGHATLFRGGLDRAAAFTPVTPAIQSIQQRLKSVFDPQGIFNPQRLNAHG